MVEIRFRPDRPSESYLESGLGWYEPLIVLLVFGLFPAMVILLVLLKAVLGHL